MVNSPVSAFSSFSAKPAKKNLNFHPFCGFAEMQQWTNNYFYYQELKNPLLDVTEFPDQLEQSSAVYVGLKIVCESQNLFVVSAMCVNCVQNRLEQNWTRGPIVSPVWCVIFLITSPEHGVKTIAVRSNQYYAQRAKLQARPLVHWYFDYTRFVSSVPLVGFWSCTKHISQRSPCRTGAFKRDLLQRSSVRKTLCGKQLSCRCSCPRS